ncbi:peptidoglycan recognition family protein [Caminicella sporogenes]|uniref:peptidoglycan recognition protein family protein n=1 Tax=Caminicella sporogenes TaxID=166485 RepID=UPI002540377A|nr:peptidoglycan recognition family protein [Caminicella sporogenes]WIF95004.1 peptidoglycan recognition family protein [Caminicella sporogenes]WIF95109.1 peptidoglycan recognition family protein [Caminicella sporogenes]
MRRFKQYTVEEYLNHLKTIKITRKITQIHLHHTWKPTKKSYFEAGNKEGVIFSIYSYHTKKKGWSDIGQHVTLAPDGTVFDGRDINKEPASIKGHNEGAFAIEMIGNFDVDHEKLEGVQLDSLIKLLKGLFEIFETDNLIFHREYSPKTCPGSSISKEWLLELINRKDNINDDISSWAEEAQKWVTENNISDGTRAKELVTREEIWTMLYRFYKLIGGK